MVLWLPSQYNIMSEIDLRSCYLYYWSTERPCLRTGCSSINWSSVFQWEMVCARKNRGKQEGQGVLWQLEQPKTTSCKWLSTSGKSKPFSKVSYRGLFIHLSSLGAGMSLGCAPGGQEVENSCFNAAFVLINEFIKEADPNMHLCCNAADDELTGNGDN